MFYKIDKMLDVCGLLCPEPMVMIRKNLRLMLEGEIILVIVDDPSIKRDILFLSCFMKQELVMQLTQCIPYCYLIKKVNCRRF